MSDSVVWKAKNLILSNSGSAINALFILGIFFQFLGITHIQNAVICFMLNILLNTLNVLFAVYPDQELEVNPCVLCQHKSS